MPYPLGRGPGASDRPDHPLCDDQHLDHPEHAGRSTASADSRRGL